MCIRDRITTGATIGEMIIAITPPLPRNSPRTSPIAAITPSTVANRVASCLLYTSRCV
ncbi:hypothetical protein [Erwinia amylovora]